MENEWFEDGKGNRCSVAYFGSKEKAQEALDSLRGCTDCSDCSGCTGCSDCFGCYDCTDCSGCSGCSDCSDCSDCFRCTDCTDCSDCSICSGCSDCTDCSDCSGCFDCRRCSDCYRCSDINNKVATDAPPIPVIHDIDKIVYAACSEPGALNMLDWHTCKTTHCRAGWVVHLAGDAGYAAEAFYGPLLAAQLIYRESGSPISPAKFLVDDDKAMADMRLRAGL